MGLSSSQGRLLLLTSRISDIELAETLIAQRQQLLAQDRENIAKEYNEAMGNYKITIKVPDSSEEGKFTKEDLNYANMAKTGYFLTNANKQVYLKKNAETGEWDTSDISGDILTINSDGKAVIAGFSEPFDIVDGSDWLNNEKTIQNSILNGVVYVLKAGNTDPLSGITMENLAADTNMEYVLDTSDDAQAESKYEYELARISRADNQLDMEMQQLETQHNAALKEYDSIKNVIKNNVDRTFNLFSNG